MSTTRMQDFKYDVAFSFLAKDEQLATDICDQMAGRIETFLYSRRQEEVAGTDGHETFARVFEEEARVVVIALGNGWGERGFTLIEKTAIQNRAMQHGWAFLQVLPVCADVVLPKFIPKAHIYFDWSRWGIDGACSVIESHVAREGGEPREPSFQIAAANKKRELELETARNQFRGSAAGVDWFVTEVQILFAQLAELAQTSSIQMRAEQSNGMISVQARGVSMSVVAHQRYGDLREAIFVSCSLYDTSTGRPGACPEAAPTTKCFPDLERSGAPAWRCGDRCYATPQLAEYMMIRMVEHSRP